MKDPLCKNLGMQTLDVNVRNWEENMFKNFPFLIFKSMKVHMTKCYSAKNILILTNTDYQSQMILPQSGNLQKPPHLRIMDCVLLLFQKKIERALSMDPEKPCCKPSWGESLKKVIKIYLYKSFEVYQVSASQDTQYRPNTIADK